MIETIGYIGSLLIALSLLMSNIKKLRFINLLGAAAFTAYGFATKTYPVMAVNLFIACVNIWYLARLTAKKDFFKILHVKSSDAYLKHFLNFYNADIKHFFPEFDIKKIKQPECVFILRNLISAGLFICAIDNDTAKIELDYVTPAYRDFKTAKYFFTEKNISTTFPSIKYLKIRPLSKKHLRYVKKIGFMESKEETGVLIKQIK